MTPNVPPYFEPHLNRRMWFDDLIEEWVFANGPPPQRWHLMDRDGEDSICRHGYGFWGRPVSDDPPVEDRCGKCVRIVALRRS